MTRWCNISENTKKPNKRNYCVIIFWYKNVLAFYWKHFLSLRTSFDLFSNILCPIHQPSILNPPLGSLPLFYPALSSSFDLLKNPITLRKTWLLSKSLSHVGLWLVFLFYPWAKAQRPSEVWVKISGCFHLSKNLQSLPTTYSVPVDPRHLGRLRKYMRHNAAFTLWRWEP